MKSRCLKRFAGVIGRNRVCQLKIYAIFVIFFVIQRDCDTEIYTKLNLKYESECYERRSTYAGNISLIKLMGTLNHSNSVTITLNVR